MQKFIFWLFSVLIILSLASMFVLTFFQNEILKVLW